MSAAHVRLGQIQGSALLRAERREKSMTAESEVIAECVIDGVQPIRSGDDRLGPVKPIGTAGIP